MPPSNIAATEHFDAIVIGSGVGGLTVARLLSWFGRKQVLVLEQHTTLGGLTHVFSRPKSGDPGAAPYEFATGVHYLGRNSEAASLPALFAQLCENRLQWHKLPDPFDIIAFPSGSFAIPDDEAAYKAELLKRFPQEKVAIECYFRDVRRATRGIVAASIVKALPRSIQPLARAIVRRAFPLAFERTGAYLDRSFADPALRSLLAAQWGTWHHPMIPMLKSLARAPASSAATKPQRLSSLQRVLIGQVIGIEPKFAAHEILRLSKQKDNNPVLSPRPTIREPAPSPPIGHLPANAQAYDFRPQISPMGGPLTGPEVARILRMCCDNQFPYRAPLTCIAEVAGVHRSSLYRAVNTGEVGRDILTRLSPVLRKIAAGKLAWRRLNVRGKGVGRQGGGQWEEFRPR